MTLTGKTALLTGAARRLGAQTAATLHDQGANIIIHYGQSAQAARALVDKLNAQREHSATAIQADLTDLNAINQLAEKALQSFGRLDILVNNASTFYPTPLGKMSEAHWQDLMASNVKAPLFLSQACYPFLKQNSGCIINMADIHGRSPLKQHTIYCCAKSANIMLTRSLALEMGPEVRVNAIAPGAILWPEESGDNDDQKQQQILDQVPLGRRGDKHNIAETILFLVNNDYINGQIIAVDGGRQLF